MTFPSEPSVMLLLLALHTTEGESSRVDLCALMRFDGEPVSWLEVFTVARIKQAALDAPTTAPREVRGRKARKGTKTR